MAMNNVEQVLHMVGGAGVTSYATNSTLQEKAIYMTKCVVEEAVKEVYRAVHPERLVVADLGCSSSPNTFLVISEVVEAISDLCHESGHDLPEIQYCLNDLPGNDFNTMFLYARQFEKKVREEKGEDFVPYVVGVPGSFYGRLFPSRTVHLVHSSYSLMWLSQVPRGLQSEADIPLNKGNIYIAKTSPQIVVELYLKQFQNDFSTFLRLRFKELGSGGRMVLTFLGRTSSPSTHGTSLLWGLLADALQTMVLEGLVNVAKLDAFDLPYYTASMEEVMTVVKTEGLFDVDQVEIFESNWDPSDDSNDDSVFDNLISGENVAKCIRAALEPMLEKHFGAEIMDELFKRYAQHVASHLLVEKTKHVVFVISLKKIE